jgi:hypothetical protein
MTSKALLVGTFAFFLLAASMALLAVFRRPVAEIRIESFEDCIEAGYPIMESYPRQCLVPDGRTFVEEVPLDECANDYECADGFYCKGGICEEFIPDLSCRVDAGCQLINFDNRFSCCWAGACEAIDYSLDKWMAVNKMWFEQGRSENCPTGRECGPAPMCATRIINEDFAARCIDQRCEKVQL